MSIKEHHLYPIYLEYLENSKSSKGAIELCKISEDAFFAFKFKYDTDNKFKNDYDRLHTSIVREDKIDNILE